MAALTALILAIGLNTSLFTGLFSKRSMVVHLGHQPDGNSLSCHTVSGNYFSLLGVQMDLGRGFLEEEGQLETPQAVVVLSYRVWQNRFGGDQQILGKQIRIDGIPFNVVGVASRDFVGTGPERHDLWIPFPALSLLRPNDPSVPSLLRNPDYCCSATGAGSPPGILSGMRYHRICPLKAANMIPG